MTSRQFNWHDVRMLRPPKPVFKTGPNIVLPLYVSHAKIALDSYLEEEEKKCHEEDVKRSRSCVPIPFRPRKVSAADVASIGQASDTVVEGQTPGRSVHERAKEAVNNGQYHESLKLFESILTAQVRRFGPCHASVAAAMHNVAVCRHRLGEHATAERIFLETLLMRKETLGENHLDVAATLSKLGSTQLSLGKLDQAYQNIKQALRIARLIVGDKHKLVAQIQGHLASLFYEAGELMAAEYALSDALNIYKQIISSTDDKDACIIQTSDTLCNIGSIQNKRKRHDEAVESFLEALNLQRGVYVHNHAKITSTLDNLAYSYVKSKQYSHALACYETMIQGQVSQCGVFNKNCLVTLRKQALMYEKLGCHKQGYQKVKDFLYLVPNSRESTELRAEVKQIIERLSKKASTVAS